MKIRHLLTTLTCCLVSLFALETATAANVSGQPKMATPVAGSVDSRSAQVRVACVGDSITYGFGLKNPKKESYPAQLQALLGDQYNVGNFGKNGATVLKKGHAPYWKAPQYIAALKFRPDVVVIKLGTNDTRPQNIGKHKAEFVPNYVELIRRFQSLESKPTVWICYSVPIYTEHKGMTNTVLKNEILPLVEEVSQVAGVKVIDLNSVMINQPEMFSDGLHPNPDGAGVIAKTVAASITQ